MLTRNRLLLLLNETERREVLAGSTLQQFKRGEVIRPSDDPVMRVVFPETMIASLEIAMADGRTANVALIGREGLVGFQVLLGGGQMPSATVCFVPGAGHVIPAVLFRRVVGRGGITRVVGAFAQGLINELAQAAACNRLHDVEQRTARWMLFIHDRVGGSELIVTQEYLAAMVGASRTQVAVIASRLSGRGIAQFRHGKLQITDRAALEEVSCECYAVVRGEFGRLLAWHPAETPA